MTSADLLALAERVEAAAGADREIDALIVVALDLRPDWCATAGGELWVDMKSDVNDPPIRMNTLGKRSSGNPPIGHYAAYTASLDAAMTLVPEGQEWAVGSLFGECRASVGEPVIVNAPFCRAATPALALTAAALRARAATEQGG